MLTFQSIPCSVPAPRIWLGFRVKKKRGVVVDRGDVEGVGGGKPLGVAGFDQLTEGGGLIDFGRGVGIRKIERVELRLLRQMVEHDLLLLGREG